MRVTILALLMLAYALSDTALAEPRPETIPTYAGDVKTIKGYVLRPDGPGPFPAVVALHGCAGLWRKTGLASRETDWGERFRKGGYVVLFPDSFGSRGHESLCKVKKRPVKHRHRVGDIRGAADWLAEQPHVDAKRIALIGWSNGGSSLLRAMAPDAAPLKTDFRVAIAFYPSCRWALNKADWQPRLKPRILIGAADDWTPPETCQSLAKKWDTGITLFEGAYHGFDAPNSKVRKLTGRAFSARGDGIVHIGTNPQARRAAITQVMSGLKAAFSERPR